MGKKTERISVHAQIHRDIQGQIFSGVLRPGDMLPSESQLCAEYAASRETVRKGLKILEGENLIYSKPKIGYFVSQPDHSDFTLGMPEELKDCEARYLDIHGIMPDELIQTQLQIPPERKVIELTQAYTDAAGQIAAIEVKYIPYERAYPSIEGEIRYAVLPDITFAKLASYEYYSDVSVSAVLADPHLARTMNCGEGEPLLLVERVIFRQNGSRVGYSRYYGKPSHGVLRGTSGKKI